MPDQTLGLIAELISLLRNHSTAFFLFLGAGASTSAAGILFYLYSQVTVSRPPIDAWSRRLVLRRIVWQIDGIEIEHYRTPLRPNLYGITVPMAPVSFEGDRNRDPKVYGREGRGREVRK